MPQGTKASYKKIFTINYSYKIGILKKVIIIGATSGMGKKMAEYYAQNNCLVGISGRRALLLQQIQQAFPGNIITACFDVQGDENITQVESLIRQLGGVDLFIYNAGYGEVSDTLDWAIDKQIHQTNVKGFLEMTNYMYNYFLQQGHGQIVATSSIASNRGNSHAPAYSASKAFMSTYMEGLYMRSKRMNSPVVITDIQPGFVRTKMAKGHGQFWVASADEAVKQMIAAIEKKKWRVYVTRRWQLIAILMRTSPGWLYHRMA